MRIIPSIEFIPGKSNVGSALSVIGPDFTFSRTTTPVAGVATRVNASGLIETVPDNVLRLDYPIGGGCPAALIEPSAQNLVLQSEAFDDGYWTKELTTVSANTSISPDGLMTADLITASGSVSDNHDVNRLITLTSGTTYTVSCFFKKGTTRYAYIGSASSPWVFTAILDLDTGLVTNVTAGATADAVLIGGFYRLRITATATSTASARFRFGLTSDANNRTSLLTTSDTIIVWGAQLETGAVATTYIPTTTASATRAAEVCSVSGVSGYIGQTEGTIYAEVVLSRVNTSPMIVISDGSDNNRIQIAFLTATSLLATIRVAGNNENYSVTIPTIPTAGGVYKMALGYKTNDYCFALNGTTYASTSSRGVPACNKLGLGTSATESSFLNDRIRAAAIYTTRLSNATLESMTSLSQSYAELASSFSYTVI